MKISLIVAMANNRVIGLNNKMPWHLSADLKKFKKITMGSPIIMGRKTFESLKKALPNRTNIIITRSKNYNAENCIVVNSLHKALLAAKDDSKPYILGGAQIYKQAIKFADRLDITFVHHEFEADAFFPEIDLNIWKEISRQDFKADTKNKYDYSFVSFERK